jgi:hypothetical protein
MAMPLAETTATSDPAQATGNGAPRIPRFRAGVRLNLGDLPFDSQHRDVASGHEPGVRLPYGH